MRKFFAHIVIILVSILPASAWSMEKKYADRDFTSTAMSPEEARFLFDSLSGESRHQSLRKRRRNVVNRDRHTEGDHLEIDGSQADSSSPPRAVDTSVFSRSDFDSEKKLKALEAFMTAASLYDEDDSSEDESEGFELNTWHEPTPGPINYQKGRGRYWLHTRVDKPVPPELLANWQSVANKEWKSEEIELIQKMQHQRSIIAQEIKRRAAITEKERRQNQSVDPHADAEGLAITSSLNQEA